eukprot:SAG31_NODE_22995_length_513_cov_1.618357_1_plen_96_part_10
MTVPVLPLSLFAATAAAALSTATASGCPGPECHSGWQRDAAWDHRTDSLNIGAARQFAQQDRPMAVAWYDATQGMVDQYAVSAIPWSNITHIVYNG